MRNVRKAKAILARSLVLLLAIGAMVAGCRSAQATAIPAAPANATTPAETHTPEPPATASRTETANPTSAPAPTDTPTPTVLSQPAGNPFGQVSQIQSPDKQRTAVLDTRAGSPELQRADGKTSTVFVPGSTVDSVTWSPDSQNLLVVKANYYPSPSHTGYVFLGPIEIWRVRPNQNEKPTRLFQSPTDPTANPGGADHIDFGPWSPNSRTVLFWLGSTSGSFQAGGAPLFALDVEDGKSTRLCQAALLNPRYQSWSPDSSAVAFTAGGYRSAQVNKWLNLYDAQTGKVTKVVDQNDAVPGIVAWSPRRDLVAYAAVRAADTGEQWADYHAFDNPAILKRRIYLLDPKTGKHWRLDNIDAFQDAPAWSADGSVLYYVQREGDDMVLMGAGPASGRGQVIDGSRRPAPGTVGYYGQSEWDDVLAFRPDMLPAQIPALAQTYADSNGYSIQYPAGWAIGMGWRYLIYGCGQCATVSPSAETDALNDGPFSGKLFLSIESLGPVESALRASDMEKLLTNLLAVPGPGQIVKRGDLLKAFDRHTITVAGRLAVRLETMGELGEVDHMLVIANDGRTIVLRGRGDGRVFDAIAATLKFALPSTPVPRSALPPVSEWPVYRHPLGVEVRYPSGWRVDSTAVSVRFCDGPAAGECVDIVNHPGLKQASDFIAEVGTQAAMTQTLTLDGQPAAFVQINDPTSFEGIANVVAVVTPDGRGLTIDNRTDAALFEQVLTTFRFFKSNWP